MRYILPALLLTTTLTLLGCAGDKLAGPQQAPPLSFDVEDDDDEATVVVTSEEALRAALAAASPGDVIEIEGLIEVTSTVLVDTDNITIRGGDDGSGLVASDAVFSSPGVLLGVDNADGVMLENLVIDGGNLDAAPRRGVVVFEAGGLHFTENTVICPDGCVFLVGADDAVIVENHMKTTGPTISGIHLQDGSDRALIRDNNLVATEPLADPLFGAIRLRDSTGHTIEDNDIRGPWTNGMHLTNVTTSVIADNEVAEALSVGILVDFESADNVIEDNNLEDSGNLSCQDTTSGSGTAGTANTWDDNEGEAPSDPAGVCAEDGEDDDDG